MNSGFDLQVTLTSAGLAAALVAGACAMTEPKAEKPVPLPIGATGT
jgi:hypothetical protein